MPLRAGGHAVPVRVLQRAAPEHGAWSPHFIPLSTAPGWIQAGFLRGEGPQPEMAPRWAAQRRGASESRPARGQRVVEAALSSLV